MEKGLGQLLAEAFSRGHRGQCWCLSVWREAVHSYLHTFTLTLNQTFALTLIKPRQQVPLRATGCFPYGKRGTCFTPSLNSDC
jgi:hypothetical protein